MDYGGYNMVMSMFSRLCKPAFILRQTLAGHDCDQETKTTIITIIIIMMMMMMKITTGDAHLVERLAHTWTLVLELAPMSLSLFLCLRSKSLHDDDQRDGDYEQNPPSSAGH